ncbi:T9SS type A sorting domain-containing protein [Psychroflexus sp. MES1-P1E]|uniref:T9SS type A sorting domain-containing protein n=1 Tax=Psychroflexus sp. MES1-P1E TaxID=2058320 RepID=UPI000C7C77C5|nr:T9SS type A sorting domain-containing protein [Psychroflexus sp. MES1-P1E]PKG41602.1 hypothetical protein CXF67_14655 [Psychroflexus sp. MES1-P1E]
MKLKKLLILGLSVLCSTTLLAQKNLGKQATLNEDGTISVSEVEIPQTRNANQGGDALFTFDRPANPSIKNSRGVTLADLNDDGVEEIIFGVNTTLFALNGDGSIFFEKTVEGPILLPPSIADLDDDGSPEIIINTGYPTTVGRVYVKDNNGDDLAGWPITFNDKWMINAPAIADVDGDGTLDIVTGERFASAQGFVHALNIDGTEINENWPVEIPATPAFTPSIGDINNDGSNEVVIAASSAGMYVFNSQGEILDGFPLVQAGVNYSYQSPMLVDLDSDETLEIIGSNHGDNAAFYVLNHDATYAPGWPIALGGWTYAPSTVADLDDDGTYEIFMGDRNTSGDGTDLPTIYGLAPDGTNITNFPIQKYGGNEGVITIGDINDDGVLDIIISSTLTDAAGFGYIHAYSSDGSGEIDGFPLRPEGFTFLNGAVLGDVDGDGLMDLTANSHSILFGAGVDTFYLNTYNLNVPYDESKILSNGYKGSNTRDGLIAEEVLNVNQFTNNQTLVIYPNPTKGILNIKLPVSIENAQVNIYSIDGRVILNETINVATDQTLSYDFKQLTNGIYFVSIKDGKTNYLGKWIKE